MAAARAAQSLAELTGQEPEGVIGIEQTDGGWRVRLEVVELERIPTSTDLLALYDVDLDQDAGLSALRRVRRYQRGHAGED